MNRIGLVILLCLSCQLPGLGKQFEWWRSEVKRGAIIGLNPFNPLANVVVFQYNPDTMTRRLEPRAVNAEGDRGEAMRLTEPPKETISLSIEIDATDHLDQANPLVTTIGSCPTLAAPFSKDRPSFKSSRTTKLQRINRS